jgi:hypothetical protein
VGDKKIANLFLKDVYYNEKAYIYNPWLKFNNSSLFEIQDHIYVFYTCVVWKFLMFYLINMYTYIGLPDVIALFNRKERNRIHDTQFLYMHDYSRTVNVQAKE